MVEVVVMEGTEVVEVVVMEGVIVAVAVVEIEAAVEGEAVIGVVEEVEEVVVEIAGEEAVDEASSSTFLLQKNNC